MFIVIRRKKDEIRWRVSLHKEGEVIEYSEHVTALSAIRFMRYMHPDVMVHMKDYNSPKDNGKWAIIYKNFFGDGTIPNGEIAKCI